MSTINCSSYTSQETCDTTAGNNCKWYSYGNNTNKCVSKADIIPISSYVFQAFQKKTKNSDGTINNIDIYVNKYKSAKYSTLTLEPMITKINVTLVYKNGKSARSTINMPNNYTTPTGYTSITYPNITRPGGLAPMPTTNLFVVDNNAIADYEAVLAAYNAEVAAYNATQTEFNLFKPFIMQAIIIDIYNELQNLVSSKKVNDYESISSLLNSLDTKYSNIMMLNIMMSNRVESSLNRILGDVKRILTLCRDNLRTWDTIDVPKQINNLIKSLASNINPQITNTIPQTSIVSENYRPFIALNFISYYVLLLTTPKDSETAALRNAITELNNINSDTTLFSSLPELKLIISELKTLIKSQNIAQLSNEELNVMRSGILSYMYIKYTIYINSANGNLNKIVAEIQKPAPSRPAPTRPAPVQLYPEQYFTFIIPAPTITDRTTYNKNSIPTHFKINLENIVSTDDFEKVMVKNIQYEDTMGGKSIIIKVENLDDDEFELIETKNRIAEKVSRSNSLINENKKIINYIQQKTGNRITYTE